MAIDCQNMHAVILLTDNVNKKSKICFVRFLPKNKYMNGRIKIIDDDAIISYSLV